MNTETDPLSDDAWQKWRDQFISAPTSLHGWQEARQRVHADRDELMRNLAKECAAHNKTKIEIKRLRDLLRRIFPWVIGVESNEKLLEEARAALEGKE